MYNEELEKLIEIALSDGKLSKKEEQILLRKAEEFGINKDEFEMVLESRISEKRSTKDNLEENKDDKLRRCPACKALVNSFQAECPECHTEFRNFGSSKTLKDLFDQLQRVPSEVKKLDFRYKTDSRDKEGATSHEEGFDTQAMEHTITNRQAEIIENFPIPYTKQDVLEFLHFAIPKMKSNKIDKRLRMVWRHRFEEVLERAKVVFKTDSTMLKELNSIIDRVNTFIYERKRKRNRIILIIFIVLLSSSIITVLIFNKVIFRKIYSNSQDLLKAKITNALIDKKVAKAKRLSSYYDYEIDRLDGIAHIFEVEIGSLIEEGNVSKADILFTSEWNDFLNSKFQISDFTRPILFLYINRNEQSQAKAFIRKIQILGYPEESETLQKMCNEKWPK